MKKKTEKKNKKHISRHWIVDEETGEQKEEKNSHIP